MKEYLDKDHFNNLRNVLRVSGKEAIRRATTEKELDKIILMLKVKDNAIKECDLLYTQTKKKKKLQNEHKDFIINIIEVSVKAVLKAENASSVKKIINLRNKKIKAWDYIHSGDMLKDL